MAFNSEHICQQHYRSVFPGQDGFRCVLPTIHCVSEGSHESIRMSNFVWMMLPPDLREYMLIDGLRDNHIFSLVAPKHYAVP